MSDNLPAILGPPQPAEWQAITAMAETLARSNLVPGSYRGKAHEIIAATLYGRELGVPPMVALNKIHVIDGRPALAADLMTGLILRAGHQIEPIHNTAEVARLRARRAGGEHWSEVEYSLADARTAGLVGKDNWKKNPAAMLWARCISKAARMMFADVLMGFTYTPEELDAPTDEDGTPLPAEHHDDAGLADFGDRDEIVKRIAHLDDRAKTLLREAWKDAGLPRPERLAADDVPSAQALLAAVEPEDAELVATGGVSDVEGGPHVAGSGESGGPGDGCPPGLSDSPVIGAQQVRHLAIECRAAGLSDDDRHDLVAKVTGGRTRTSKELTEAEYLLLMGELRQLSKETR